jgi:hypothetical protein
MNKLIHPKIHKKENTMQLTYRAAQYQVNAPVIEMNQKIGIGVYRGIALQFQSAKLTKQFQSAIPLKYRGVSYVGLR